ncbi:BID domain-containing T4SS effector [Bartonella sp. AR 15-3]|uniref:BID domain-containing T4SS effector n=1 Tax=Bartonella sp. AR 15-3 TaxID=545617 RepID=UPI0001F4B9F0|nr:BID domain-containing T4SS effector [Bartonella sp. AR 15-3]OPB31784.1 Bartonella effector protein Bep6 [Bartonella sp. AR 15-3]CBI79188.1 Bartonella effector protein (Bep); substrate of VirB T4SS [Bartonella sp. AR 15-3]
MYSGYYYADSKILKNKYNIIDEKKLNKRCAHDAKRVMVDLYQEQPPKEFDSSYLKYLHKRLFERSFEWAGYIRGHPFKFADGTIAKMLVIRTPDLQHKFLVGHKIEKSLHQFDQMLSDKNNLQNLSRKEFVDEAVKLFSFLNYIHPFKDGNGRAQRIFFVKLAQAAGHQLDFSVVTEKRMIHACSNTMPKHANYEAMQHLFEDISNPEKVDILRKAIYCDTKSKRKDLINKIVMVAREGISYSGLYKESNFDSIMIETMGFCILCCKDYFPPEKLKALKSGDELTFTIPMNRKNLDQILIPNEKLAPLKEEEIIKNIENDCRVQESIKKIEELSRFVYGKPQVLEKSISLINANPRVVEEISRRIMNTPQSLAKVKGKKILGIKTSRYKASENNSKILATEISNYADIVSEIRSTALRIHKAKEKRLAHVIKMPSEKLQNVLSLSTRFQLNALDSSPEIYVEMNRFIRSISLRLSPDENREMRNANYKALAESIGISENKAKVIAETVKKIDTVLDIIQPKRPQMQYMSI